MYYHYVNYSSDIYNLFNFFKMHIKFFWKTNKSTSVYKNGHISVCDQYFFLKLAPLDLAHSELSSHAKILINFNIDSY